MQNPGAHPRCRRSRLHFKRNSRRSVYSFKHCSRLRASRKDLELEGNVMVEALGNEAIWMVGEPSLRIPLATTLRRRVRQVFSPEH